MPNSENGLWSSQDASRVGKGRPYGDISGEHHATFGILQV